MSIQDVIFISLFAFEFTIKFIDGKWKYFFNDYGWIDFLSSLPFLNPALKGLRAIRVLRFARILRLLRFLKLAKETSSPLKEKFFIGLSSVSLIVIILLGYSLYNYQYNRLLENEIRYIKSIKNSIENGIDINSIISKEPSILRIEFTEEKPTDIIQNLYKTVSQNNVLSMRCYKPTVIFKYIVQDYATNRQRVIQKVDNVLSGLTSDTSYHYNINNLRDILTDEIIIQINWSDLDKESFNYFSEKFISEISDYYFIEEEIKPIKDNFDIITKWDLEKNELIIFQTENNYLIYYSFKSLLRNLRTFESFIIGMSFLTVIIIIICLDYYIQNTLLNRLSKLSNDMEESIQTYKAKKNIMNDNEKPFEKKSVQDDEIKLLTNAFSYLKQKLDDSFEKINVNVNRIKILNMSYYYFQKTYNLDKQFNYLILALSNKNYYKFDRVALFLKNMSTGKYVCRYAIGANTRDELISKFSNSNEYYNFYPSISETFDLYKEHPYFNNSFEKSAFEIEFDIDYVEDTLSKCFSKLGEAFRLPNDFVYDNKIVNTLKKDFNSDEFIIAELKCFDNFFGFLFLDNVISKEKMTKFRIQNLELYINEILIIINNLLILPYLSENEKNQTFDSSYSVEKNNSYKIIKEFF